MKPFDVWSTHCNWTNNLTEDAHISHYDLGSSSNLNVNRISDWGLDMTLNLVWLELGLWLDFIG